MAVREPRLEGTTELGLFDAVFDSAGTVDEDVAGVVEEEGPFTAGVQTGGTEEIIATRHRTNQRISFVDPARSSKCPEAVARDLGTLQRSVDAYWETLNLSGMERANNYLRR